MFDVGSHVFQITALYCHSSYWNKSVQCMMCIVYNRIKILKGFFSRGLLVDKVPIHGGKVRMKSRVRRRGPQAETLFMAVLFLQDRRPDRGGGQYCRV